MKKNKPIDYSKITPKMSEFICGKVAALGSVEAVRLHYGKRCLVDRFAKVVAKALFVGKRGR